MQWLRSLRGSLQEGTISMADGKAKLMWDDYCGELEYAVKKGSAGKQEIHPVAGGYHLD